MIRVNPWDKGNPCDKDPWDKGNPCDKGKRFTFGIREILVIRTLGIREILVIRVSGLPLGEGKSS